MITPNHLIFISLDFLFHQLFVNTNSSNSEFISSLNLMFDRTLFIFNPNLNVDFRGQLLSKCKSEFNHFGLLRILRFFAFYYYINFNI